MAPSLHWSLLTVVLGNEDRCPDDISMLQGAKEVRKLTNTNTDMAGRRRGRMGMGMGMGMGGRRMGMGADEVEDEVEDESPLWAQHSGSRIKCNNNIDVQYVQSQEDCQAIAEAAGHPFYSFRHNANRHGHKCMSSAHCDEPLLNRNNEWHIYHDSSPVWVHHLGDHVKCNNNVDVQYVESQEMCQAVAEEAGHPFFSFRHNADNNGHKCMSSAHCDEPLVDRTNEWRVYHAADLLSLEGPDGMVVGIDDEDEDEDEDLVTLHWNGGSVTLTEEVTCLSGPTQIANQLGVPNDRLTGISGLRSGCEVKLFEHSRHCRATADADDNCDDQLCMSFHEDTTSLGGMTGKASGVTLVCHMEPTHYLAVTSWPEWAWGAWDTEAMASSIEKCFALDQTEDGDGSGILFTSCCTLEGLGMGRDCETTRNTNFATAALQCEEQGGRLCTAQEALAIDESSGRRTTATQGCSVDGPRSATGSDLNRLWTSTPCIPED